MFLSLVCGLLAAGAAIGTSTTNGTTSTMIQYAPIPSSAFGPAISNATSYRVEAFGGGAYMMTDDLYQAMFLVSSESVIVVDAPPTIGKNLLYAIGNTTDLPISHVVYSHAHADHIGAAYLYG